MTIWFVHTKFIHFQAIFLTLFGYLIFDKNSKLPNFHLSGVPMIFTQQNFTSFTEVQLLFLMSATPYITYQMLANNLNLPYIMSAINIHTKCLPVAYIAIQHITTPFYMTITTASRLQYISIHWLLFPTMPTIVDKQGILGSDMVHRRNRDNTISEPQMILMPIKNTIREHNTTAPLLPLTESIDSFHCRQPWNNFDWPLLKCESA